MILLCISFEDRNITNCSRTKTSSPLRQRLTHSHSTQTGRKSSQCGSQLPRLTSHFRPQTTVSLSDSRTQSAPDPERRAIKTGSQHLVLACTRAFLPTPALLVGQDLAFISILPRPAMHSGGPVDSQGLALFSSLCPPPPPSLSPSPAAQTSGNYSRSWVQAGSGRKTAATPRAGGVAEARVPPQGPRAATAVRIREMGSGGRGKSGIDGPYLP